MTEHKRRMHVHRVYRTDDSGHIVDDSTWIDLARIDKLSVIIGGDPSGTTGQTVNYTMDWGDEVSPVKGRTYHRLKIDKPQSLGGEDSLFISLQLIESATFLFGADTEGGTGEKIKFVFHNDPSTPARRKVTPVRVVSNDLNHAISFPDVTVGDLPPASSPDALIDWDRYQDALANGTADDSQYVDAEVIDAFTINLPSPTQFRKGLGAQWVKFELKGNDVIEQLFKAPPSREDKLYRLDPFESIVNVSWGGLAVEFGDRAADAPGDGHVGGEARRRLVAAR